MVATEPRELPELFLQALNSGDADALALLYETTGVVAADVSQAVSGRDAIRSMAMEFLAGKPIFELHDTEVVEAGDIALVRSRWTVSMRGSGVAPSDVEIRPTLVARRQADGCWLVVIDRPLHMGPGQ